MRSSRPSGGTATTSTAPPRDSAGDTVLCDEGAAERVYRECREGGLPRGLGPISIHSGPAPYTSSLAESERTQLAGSIAPQQRKSGPSVEVSELGRGGIGRVYVSIDMGLQREIAIKEILPELLQGEPESVQGLRARFLREARVTGQLEHPNIVPVYEVGERDDGSLYYSMRLIRGKTLKQALDASRALSERLALLNHFLGLCNAIAYAHSRGVIHRDIKPQNVMLGEFGETVVLDWGVAKVRNSDEAHPAVGAIREPSDELPEQTRLGQVLGTPAYMAPEALMGQVERVDERSDVWSLGVVLYLLLKGELPFPGSLAHLVSRARSLSVRPAHQLEPEVPPELSAVAERALRQEPELRYQTAGAMARDIEAYLTGAKVGAYAYSSWELMRRFYHRQRASVLVAFVALLSICVLSVVGYRRVVDARDRALSAQEEQRKSAISARERLALLLAESASFALQRRDTGSAELLAARALNVEPSLEVKGVIASIGAAAQPRLSSSHAFARHCVSLAYATKRSSVVCASGREVLVVNGGGVSVVSRHTSEVTAVSVTADAEYIFRADRRGVVAALRDGKPAYETAPRTGSGSVTALALSPGEEYLLVGYAAARIEVLRLPELAVEASFDFEEPVTALAMSSRGALAVGGRLGALKVWSNLKQPRALNFQGHHGTLTALAFSPDGVRLATGSSDQNVRLWRTYHPEQHPTIVRTGHVALSFSWSADGHHLIYGTREHRVHWVDVRLNRTTSELPGHEQQVQLVALSQDAGRLVSVDGQLKVRRWRVPVGRWRERLVEPGNVLALERGLESRSLVSAGLGSNGICLWNLANAECSARLPFRSGEVRALALSPDSKRLVAGGKRGELMVWDLETKLPVAPLFGHSADVRALSFLGDGAHLVSGDLAGKFVLWQVSGAVRSVQHTLAAGISAVSVSPDEKQVAVALRNNTIELWDSRLSKRSSRLQGHKDWVMDVAFWGDQRLVSAGADSRLIVWDLARGRAIETLQAGEGRVLSVDVSEDGRWLAAGGEDTVVRIFDLQQMRLTMTLRDHDAAIRSVRFTGEGNELASAGDDRSIRIWDLEPVLTRSPERLLAEAESRYGIHSDSVAPIQ